MAVSLRHLCRSGGAPSHDRGNHRKGRSPFKKARAGRMSEIMETAFDACSGFGCFPCGRHFVDAIVSKDNRQFLVSVKWQQVSGTAEQKVPFEVICLIEALQASTYDKAYVVLGGEGWKLREF